MVLRALASIAACGIVVAILAGCSSAPSATASEREERVYRTGSNLPVRDRDQRTTTIDPTTIDTAMPVPKGRGG